jgi:glycosyltransferase involved in cell wall biosynthesis
MLTLNIYSDLPLDNSGPAYTCEQIARRMESEDVAVRIFTPADRRPYLQTDVPVTSIVPRWARRLPFRASRIVSVPLCEHSFLEACRSSADAAAFLWGNVSSGFVRKLSNTGTFIAREKYNSAKLVAREILAQAYAGLNAADAFPDEGFAQHHVDDEMESLRRSHLIYCPSPMVAWSLQEAGIDSSKFAMTSYGFDPSRLDGTSKALAPIEGPTFLFAGYVCVRKGAHILLDAWARSGIKGRLVLVGRIEPLIAERFADVLDRPDVEHHRFTADIGSYYRSADFFVFPSLEEGGPQVTYEAAYCNLPSIVTVAGAGAIVRDGVEGTVVQSLQPDALAAAMDDASRQRERFSAMGEAAHLRSLTFIWERVGAQRRESLLERVASWR